MYQSSEETYLPPILLNWNIQFYSILNNFLDISIQFAIHFCSFSLSAVYLLIITRMSSSLVLVVGGCRGYGLSLTTALSAALTDADVMITSRDNTALQETRQKLLEQYPNRNVFTAQLDLEQLDTLDAQIKAMLDTLQSKECYSKIYVISNSGSLGPLELVQDLTSIPDIRKAIDLNVTSIIVLNSALLRAFAGKTLYLVNISSLCAIKPFEYDCVYCIGKAARDMLMRVIAEEVHALSTSMLTKSQAKLCNSTVKTLNYAPGPMDTNMQAELRQSKNAKVYIEMKEKVQSL